MLTGYAFLKINLDLIKQYVTLNWENKKCCLCIIQTLH